MTNKRECVCAAVCVCVCMCETVDMCVCVCVCGLRSFRNAYLLNAEHVKTSFARPFVCVCVCVLTPTPSCYEFSVFLLRAFPTSFTLLVTDPGFDIGTKHPDIGKQSVPIPDVS